MANLIPFWLQGRKGLGFLASVNLSLYTRTISTLHVVDARLVRGH
ncbi:MAG TPA: hypothetical protein VJU54_07215 [Nitrospiraceae bacterium]|nr:hypothetical protein [Nitrospiraceae bacterium]